MSEEEKNTTAEQESSAEQPKAESEATDSKEENAQASKESATEAKEESPKKVQSSEENARFAEMRRQNEALKKENERLRSERREGVTDSALKALDITREDLEDPDNMALAQAYMKASANGDEHPELSAYRIVSKQRKEADKQAREETQRKKDADEKNAKRVEDDKASFSRSYPNANMREILNDNSDFMQRFGSKVGIDELMGNVTKYYGIYLAMKGEEPKTSAEAKKASVPPTSNGQSTNSGNEDYDTLVNRLSKMSPSELRDWHSHHRNN